MLDTTGFAPPRRPRGLTGFVRDEAGSMTIFTMFILLGMLIVGGMAVDLMRFEAKRTLLQSTLDRAVLAAADLDQPLNPESVVRDYFQKAGLLEELRSVHVVQNLTSRTVTATAELDIDMMFMRMLGIDSLAAPAAGGATEAVTNVEVSLVLDVSNSMNQNNRIGNLRVAARDFITTIFDGIDPNNLTVNLVPYSTQVSLGPQIMARYLTRYPHTLSYCLEVPGSTYSSTVLSPQTRYNQQSHFDPWTGYSSSLRAPDLYVCSPSRNADVLAMSSNEATLKSRIANLTPDANTSIEMGAKWGVAFLDPATRPVIDGLISAGVVNSAATGRPYNYFTDENLKVLVIMTDGENTQDWTLPADRRDNVSDVWLNGSTYYVDQPEGTNIDRDGDGTRNERYFRPVQRDWVNSRAGSRLTYQDIFQRVAINSQAYSFRAVPANSWTPYYDWSSEMLTETGTSTKDSRLAQICTAAKAQGIVIFTIGFEVTDRAANVMEGCASSPSHFYRVAGLNISQAFASIANQINALRLVQ